MKKTLYFLAVFVAAGVTLPAANLVTNGSLGSCSTNTVTGVTTITGWTVNGIYDQAMCQSGTGTLGAGPAAGNAWIELNSSPGTPVSVSQTISGLTVGNSYTLTWDMRSGYGCCGTAAASAGVSINGATDLVAIPGGGNSTAWAVYSYTFTATSSSTVLSLLSQQNGTDTDAGFANVDLEAATPVVTPEPSTLLMLGAGFGLVALRRLRLS